MPSFSYYLQCPVDTARRASRDAMVNAVTTGLNNSGRYNVLCVDAETRVARGVVRDDGVMAITVSFTKRNGAVTVEDYVMIDSIAFGAMKSSSQSSGWSVLQIRSRLAPTGSSTSRLNWGEVGEVRRIVSEDTRCSLGDVRGGITSTEVVVNGAAVGQTRDNAAVIPPGLIPETIPLSYKIAGGVAVVAVAAIATAYVVRAFK